MKKTNLGLMLLPAAVMMLGAIGAYGQCSNADMNGLYYSSFGGTVLVGTTNASHVDLGKLTFDGSGNISGTATASVAGTVQTLPFTGSYTIKANCSGTGTLTSGNNTANFNLELTGGGSGAEASITSSTLGQIGEGRFYRAANSTGAVCGLGSLSGAYGLIVSGGTYAGGVRTGYDAVAQATFDGNGGVTIAGEVTAGSSTGINWNATGTYVINADCSGTAQISSPGGTVNYSLARISGGTVLILETDSSTTVSGSAAPQSTMDVVPQIAFGGGWYTALYFTNRTTLSQTFVVTFTGDDGTPMTIPGAGATKRITLAPMTSTVIEALNTGSLTQGYATFSLPPGVTGYGVFRQSVPNVPDQEVTTNFRTATGTAWSFTFDDTIATTAIAIVNPSAVAVTVKIAVTAANGTSIGTGTLSLAAGKKTATTLASIAGLSGVTGKSGTALVSVSSGNVAILPLRFLGAAFTSIPATQEQ